VNFKRDYKSACNLCYVYIVNLTVVLNSLRIWLLWLLKGGEKQKRKKKIAVKYIKFTTIQIIFFQMLKTIFLFTFTSMLTINIARVIL